MKRLLFSFLIGACVLSLMPKELSAKTCKSTPNSFYYGENSSNTGEYFVAWEHGVPIIYFYSFKVLTPKSPLVAAEYNKTQGVWVFHGRVPDSLIKMVHKRWLTHKTAYKACLGDYAWQYGHYHYAPYRSHRSNSPTYNWVVVNPRKAYPRRVLIFKPKLKLHPKKNKRKKKKLRRAP